MGHVLPLTESDWLVNALALVSSVCWLALYVVAIKVGFSKKTYCIPAEALALNFSWEFVYGFLWAPTEPYYNVLQMWVNRAWCLLDVAILATCFLYPAIMYQPGTPPAGITARSTAARRAWRSYFGIVLSLCFVTMIALYGKHGAESQAETAFLIGALMSALFIRLAWLTEGAQPKIIGWAKMIGSGAITTVYLFDASSYPVIAAAGIGTFVLDVVYLRMLYWYGRKL